MFGEVVSCFLQVFLAIVGEEVFEVELLRDVFLEKWHIRLRGIDIGLLHLTVLPSSLIEIEEGESTCDVLPCDILDGHEVDTCLDEKFRDIACLHVLDYVFLEGFHELIEATLILVSLARQDEHLLDLLEVEVLLPSC